MSLEREVRVERSPIRCPYCKDELAGVEGVVACAACGARHHDACHSENGRCATCGEPAALVPRDAPPATSTVLPSPPRGSHATMARDGETITIQFPVAPSISFVLAPAGSSGRRMARSLGRLALGCVVLALLCIPLSALRADLAVALGLLFGLGACMGGFAAGILGLQTEKTPRAPAKIVLGSELDFPIDEHRTKKARRADIGHVHAGQVRYGEGSAYQLSVDLGIERIPIWTDRLKEPEIDWIADVIRAWKEGRA
jgi:hypothetical protein